MGKNVKILFILFFILLNVGIFGQEKKTPQVDSSNSTGVTPLGSYKFSGLDVVNIQNGNLYLNIPLYSSNGRGMDNQISLLYNSRLWQVVRTPDMNNTPVGYCLMWHPVDSGDDFLPAGWELSIPKMTYNVDEYAYLNHPDPYNPRSAFYMFSLRQNGAVHNFTNRLNFWGAPDANSEQRADLTLWHLDGVSIDSTFMRYHLDEDTTTSWITQRDGTRIFFKHDLNKLYLPKKYPSYIEDRNGNRLRYIMGDEEGGDLPATDPEPPELDPSGPPHSLADDYVELPDMQPTHWDIVGSSSYIACPNQGYFESQQILFLTNNGDNPAADGDGNLGINIVGGSKQLFPFVKNNSEEMGYDFQCYFDPVVNQNSWRVLPASADYVAVFRGKVLGIKSTPTNTSAEVLFVKTVYKDGFFSQTPITDDTPASYIMAFSDTRKFNVNLNGWYPVRVEFRNGSNTPIAYRRICANKGSFPVTAYLIYKQNGLTMEKEVDVSKFIEMEVSNTSLASAIRDDNGAWWITGKSVGTVTVLGSIGEFRQQNPNRPKLTVDVIPKPTASTGVKVIIGDESTSGSYNTGTNTLVIDNAELDIGATRKLKLYVAGIEVTKYCSAWETSDELKVPLERTTDGGIQVSAPCCGMSVITAKYGAGLCQSNVKITILNRPELRTNNGSVNLPHQGMSYQFKVYTWHQANQEEDEYIDVTKKCVWSLPTSGAGVGVVNVSKGLVTGRKEGDTIVTAKYCTESISFGVTVGDGSNLCTAIEDDLGRRVKLFYKLVVWQNADATNPETGVRTKPMLGGFRFQDANGVWREITINYSQFQQNWSQLDWNNLRPCPGMDFPDYADPVNGTDPVISEIVLPNGLKYTFGYDLGKNQGRGQITSITYPAGGKVEYEYGKEIVGHQANYIAVKQDVVKSRTETTNGESNTWTYSYNLLGSDHPAIWCNQINNPLNDKELHYYKRFGDVLKHDTDAKEYLIEYKGAGGNLLKSVEKEWFTDDRCNEGDNWIWLSLRRPENNARVTRETTLYHQGGNTFGTEVQYFYNMIMGEEGNYSPDGVPYYIHEYGIENGVKTLLRGTRRWYRHWVDNQLDPDYYTKNNMLDLMTKEEVYKVVNGTTWVLEAERSFSYDSEGLIPETIPAGGMAGFNENNFSGAQRGNLNDAAEKLYTPSALDIIQKSKYNQFGSVKKTWDGENNLTTYTYSLTHKYAYPVTIANARGQEVNNAYYFPTGALWTTTDANNQTTTYEYDSMGRTSKVSAPDGGVTLQTYSDSAPNFSVTQQKKIDASNWMETTTIYDGFMRPKQTTLTDSAQGAIKTKTTYDALGRVLTKSNPFRTEAQQDTTYYYDALGRVTNEVTPDGNSVSNIYALATKNNQLYQTTTTFDQVDKWRTYYYDPLGNLAFTNENDVNTTAYTYNVRGNLLSVDQGGSRVRAYQYDSLGRMTFESHPEAGDISYTHDKNGNVLTKTQAGKVATYTYDNLNRLTQVDFSDGTPAIFYKFDGANSLGYTPTYANGRMSQTSSGRVTEVYFYDKVGRLINELKQIDEKRYTISYEYDWAGNMRKITYPSGRVVQLDVSNAGRLIALKDVTRGNYLVSNITTAPFGGEWTRAYGNGLQGTILYNNRLQPTSIVHGTNVLSLGHSYNDPANGNRNNGNVQKITDQLSGKYITYGYDNLNRLLSAAEKLSATQAQTWLQSFQYDNYGNLTNKSGSGGASSGTFEYNTKNRNTALNYNAFGGITDDGAQTFTYDQREQVTQVTRKSDNQKWNYTYDPAGNRVIKEKVGGDQTTTFYLYGQGSRLLSEWTQTRGGEKIWTKDYFYAGSLAASRDNPDPVPPVISNVAAGNITDRSAVITWTTDENTDAQVAYSTDTSYGISSNLDAQMKTSHSITLTNLTPSTIYYFKVISKDGGENITSKENNSFTTAPDTTPPQFVNITAGSVSYTTATINITTNEPVRCQVQYGATTAYGGSTAFLPADVYTLSQGINLAGLTQGTTYHYRVAAQDTAALVTTGTDATFTTTADSTAPTTPVVTDDGLAQNSTTQMHGAWSSTDAESGIAEYQYAIGTTVGGTNVVGWTSTGATASVTKTGLSLTLETTYYISVKARNNANLWSAAGNSNGIIVTAGDTTPPTTPIVTDDGSTQESTTQLHAAWTASEPESSITEYQYAIGTAAGGTNIVSWISTGTTASVTKTGLSLTSGTTYYFAVKAKNSKNYWSAIGVSDGIKVTVYDTFTKTYTEGYGYSGTARSNGTISYAGLQVGWATISSVRREHRAYCAFNTTTIPANAQILSAKWYAYGDTNSTYGTATVQVDAVTTTLPLPAAAFSCTEIARNIAVFPKGTGSYLNTSIPVNYIVKAGYTQLRMRSSLTTDPGSENHYLYRNSQPRNPFYTDTTKPSYLEVTYKVARGGQSSQSTLLQSAAPLAPEERATCDLRDEDDLDQEIEVFADEFDTDQLITPANSQNNEGGWKSKQGDWLAQFNELFTPALWEEATANGVSKPEDCLMVVGQSTLSDYAIKAKIRPDYNQSRFGMAVRYNPETGSGYYLWLETQPTSNLTLPLTFKLKLEKRSYGQTVTLAETTFTNDLQWFKIKLKVKGVNLQVKVNDTKLLTAEDYDLIQGPAALFMENRLPLTVLDKFDIKIITEPVVVNKSQGGFGTHPYDQMSNDSFNIDHLSSETRPLAPLTVSSSSSTPYISHLTLHNAFVPLSSLANCSLLIDSCSLKGISAPFVALTVPPLPIMGLMLLPLPPEGCNLPNPPAFTFPASKERMFYLHTDHLGTVRAVTNSSGQVVERHDPLPFGEELTVPSSKDQILLTGKIRDAESGLDYFGARYYASKMGRFMSVDPFTTKGDAISNPQIWNLYSYCRNNPINFIDPDGRKDKKYDEKTDQAITPQAGTETPLDKNNPGSAQNKKAYNCHSYAWENGKGDPADPANQYPVSLGARKWDNDPSNNMKKHNQLDKDEPNKAGDKVIYYVDKNGDGKYNKGETIEHSAVVKSVDNEGNTATVIGKMGQGSLSVNHPNAPRYYEKATTGEVTSRAYFRKEEQKKKEN